MSLKESQVRDQFVQYLDMIEPGLTLVDSEFHLKNSMGTAGFIDILARDTLDRLVVVEIKISKHSEREAITELFKYLALLKQNISLKDSEIRLFVISTDWRELLTPFSEFYHNTHYSSAGLLLSVDSTGRPIQLDKVDIYPRNTGRHLIPRHWLQVYGGKSERDKRSKEYSGKIQSRGIVNFIILHFYFDYFGESSYGFYFAHQRENLDFYKRVLRSISEERYEEIDYFTKEFINDDDVIYEFADAAIDMTGVPAEEKEIGHPEKIKGYLEGKLWSIESINRFGKFEADTRLTDAELINDLCGYAGGSRTWYFSACTRGDKAKLQEIIDRYDFCLYCNDEWRRTIQDLFRYFETKPDDSSFVLSIFNPENVLETLFLFEKHKSDEYIPNFKMIIETPSANTIEIFEGEFVGSSGVSDKDVDIGELLDRYFDGKPSNIPLYAHLNGIASINHQIMADLGIAYGTSYRKLEHAKEVLSGPMPRVRGRSIAVGESRPTPKFEDWMLNNKEVVTAVYSIYDRYVFDIFEHLDEQSDDGEN